MTVGDPLQSVESTLTTMETLPAFPLVSGDVAGTLLDFSDVYCNAEVASFSRRTFASPCFANGAGSTPRLVNLSARHAKHLRALSATCIRMRQGERKV